MKQWLFYSLYQVCDMLLGSPIVSSLTPRSKTPDSNLAVRSDLTAVPRKDHNSAVQGNSATFDLWTLSWRSLNAEKEHEKDSLKVFEFGVPAFVCQWFGAGQSLVKSFSKLPRRRSADLAYLQCWPLAKVDPLGQVCPIHGPKGQDVICPVL